MFGEYEVEKDYVISIVNKIELPYITSIEQADFVCNVIECKKRVLEHMLVIVKWFTL